MEEMQSKTRYQAVGVPSIMMVFVLLCLFSLSVLALTTALADYKLTQKASEISAEYLGAGFAAENDIYKLSSILKKINLQSITGADELRYVLDEELHVNKEIFEDSENFYIVLREEVNSTLDLFVTMQLNKSTFALDIVKKQVVYTAQWESDDSLNLFLE